VTVLNQVAPSPLIPAFLERSFRSNPRLKAGPLDELALDHQQFIEPSAAGSVGAMLREGATGAFVATLDHEAAALFHGLTAPQQIPEWLEARPSEGRWRTVARLVCDQVLQVELADGSFADGVLAHDALFGNHDRPEVEDLARRIDPVSRAAIALAVGFPSASAVAIARRLYAYNSTPRTGRWDRLLGDPGATPTWLGLGSDAAWLKRLRARFVEFGSRTDETPWLQWVRRGANPRTSLRHKIYVSPTTEHLPEVLHGVAEVCTAMDVAAFKVGATLQGVLRPDRLVIYVPDEPAVVRMAGELSSALAGVAAHGVPFTAPLDTTGLLSWAMDPVADDGQALIANPWSWRTKVAWRLADSIARAAGHATDAAVTEFALARLRLDGVEPVGWYAIDG
jgi:hypothetical protein